MDDESRGGSISVLSVNGHAVMGGGELVLHRLLAGLPESWDAGTVVLEDGPFPDALRQDGREVTVVPAGRRAGAAPAVARLRRHVVARRPQVVLANGAKAAALCVPAVAGTGSRLVWLKHDTTFDGRAADALAFGCDRVVGVSRTVVTALHPRLAARVQVVPNGLPAVDVDHAWAARELEALTGGRLPVLALSGRLCVGKGQLELVEALPEIRRAHPRAVAVLLGDEDPAFPGHAAAIRARAAHLGVADAVVLAGRRDRAAELVSAADLLVAPSIRDARGWREGFGLAVAEALQVGTPVVAYASGSLPEVVGDAGVLVAEGDGQALARAVVELLGDPARRAALAARGRRRAAEHLSLDATLAAMLATLHDTAGQGPAAWRARARHHRRRP